MDKNVNTVVELTEKELECVTGGGIICGGEKGRFELASSKMARSPYPIPIFM